VKEETQMVEFLSIITIIMEAGGLPSSKMAIIMEAGGLPSTKMATIMPPATFKIKENFVAVHHLQFVLEEIAAAVEVAL
jgi:hypothetical protein